ncbi:hypothetical protein DFH09DRAFT_1291105 [Mycena vulgaris]|nr:hypothetical protein DFH09DRAFT_1291105 [Mycena vulgaris]
MAGAKGKKKRAPKRSSLITVDVETLADFLTQCQVPSAAVVRYSALEIQSLDQCVLTESLINRSSYIKTLLPNLRAPFDPRGSIPRPPRLLSHAPFLPAAHSPPTSVTTLIAPPAFHALRRPQRPDASINDIAPRNH